MTANSLVKTSFYLILFAMMAVAALACFGALAQSLHIDLSAQVADADAMLAVNEQHVQERGHDAEFAAWATTAEEVERCARETGPYAKWDFMRPNTTRSAHICRVSDGKWAVDIKGGPDGKVPVTTFPLKGMETLKAALQYLKDTGFNPTGAEWPVFLKALGDLLETR